MIFPNITPNSLKWPYYFSWNSNSQNNDIDGGIIYVGGIIER